MKYSMDLKARQLEYSWHILERVKRKDEELQRLIAKQRQMPLVSARLNVNCGTRSHQQLRLSLSSVEVCSLS